MDFFGCWLVGAANSGPNETSSIISAAGPCGVASGSSSRASRSPRIPGGAASRQALLRAGIGRADRASHPATAWVRRPWTAPQPPAQRWLSCYQWRVRLVRAAGTRPAPRRRACRRVLRTRVQRQLGQLPRSALDRLQDDALPLLLSSYRCPAGFGFSLGLQPGKQCRQPRGGATACGFSCGWAMMAECRTQGMRAFDCGGRVMSAHGQTRQPENLRRCLAGRERAG